MVKLEAKTIIPFIPIVTSQEKLLLLQMEDLQEKRVLLLNQTMRMLKTENTLIA